MVTYEVCCDEHTQYDYEQYGRGTVLCGTAAAQTQKQRRQKQGKQFFHRNLIDETRLETDEVSNRIVMDLLNLGLLIRILSP